MTQETTDMYRDDREAFTPDALEVRTMGDRDDRYTAAEIYTYKGARFMVEGDSVYAIDVDVEATADVQ